MAKFAETAARTHADERAGSGTTTSASLIADEVDRLDAFGQVAAHEEVHDRRSTAPAARTDPISAANTPSRMNGVWMNRFDAPTSRMIPSSRRRENADSRMVVAISSTAATSMSAAMPIAV